LDIIKLFDKVSDRVHSTFKTFESNDEYEEKRNKGILRNQELPLGKKYTASVSVPK